MRFDGVDEPDLAILAGPDLRQPLNHGLRDDVAAERREVGGRFSRSGLFKNALDSLDAILHLAFQDAEGRLSLRWYALTAHYRAASGVIRRKQSRRGVAAHDHVVSERVNAFADSELDRKSVV